MAKQGRSRSYRSLEEIARMRARVVELTDQGLLRSQIADRLGISTGHVHTLLKGRVRVTVGHRRPRS